MKFGPWEKAKPSHHRTMKKRELDVGNESVLEKEVT
jgi:hypothetical protein